MAGDGVYFFAVGKKMVQKKWGYLWGVKWILFFSKNSSHGFGDILACGNIGVAERDYFFARARIWFGFLKVQSNAALREKMNLFFFVGVLLLFPGKYWVEIDDHCSRADEFWCFCKIQIVLERKKSFFDRPTEIKKTMKIDYSCTSICLILFFMKINMFSYKIIFFDSCGRKSSLWSMGISVRK